MSKSRNNCGGEDASCNEDGDSNTCDVGNKKCAMVGNGMMRTSARIVGRKMRAASLTAQAAHVIQPISSGVMMVSGITQITAATAGVKIIHAVQAVLMESAIRR